MTKTLFLALSLPGFKLFCNWSNRAGGRGGTCGHSSFLPMVTGPWEMSEVTDLLLMRGCWGQCLVSRDKGWGWIWARTVSGFAPLQGAQEAECFPSSWTCVLLVRWKCLLVYHIHAYLIRASLDILTGTGKSHPKLMRQPRQIIFSWIFKAFFFFSRWSKLQEKTHICLFLRDINMAVYANGGNEVSRCKTTGFYDSKFSLREEILETKSLWLT